MTTTTYTGNRFLRSLDAIEGTSERLLSFEDGTGNSLPQNSSVSVVLYCLLLLLTVLVFIALGGGIREKCRQRHLLLLELAEEEEEARQGQIDLEIARIEANVKVFSEKQEFIKKKYLLKVMKNQFTTVTLEDLEGKGPRKFNFDEACSICMEPFLAGDRVAHSLEMENCLHVYHTNCILSWFVSRPEQRCPCCRQPFADIIPSLFDQSCHPTTQSQREDSLQDISLTTGTNDTLLVVEETR